MNQPGAIQWQGWAAEYSAETGVPLDIFLSLIQAESGGNQYAVGDGGASVGLFQLHERGVGYGLTVEERYDPQKQFDLMAPRIKNAYEQAIAEGLVGRDLIARVGVLAERPADQTGAAYARASDVLYAYWTGNQTAPVVGDGQYNAGNIVPAEGYTAPFGDPNAFGAVGGGGSVSSGGIGGAVTSAAAGALAPLLGGLAALFGASPQADDPDTLTLFRIGNFPINVSQAGFTSGLANSGAVIVGILLVVGAIAWLSRKAIAKVGADAVKEVVSAAAGAAE